MTILRLNYNSPTDRESLACEFDKYKALKAPFDYAFDNLESEKIYCSELVYLIYTHANLLKIDDFDLNKPIRPKYFCKLNSLHEVDCKKTSR